MGYNGKKHFRDDGDSPRRVQFRKSLKVSRYRSQCLHRFCKSGLLSMNREEPVSKTQLTL